MILGSNKSIEDRIIEYLGHKSVSAKVLWLEINALEPASVQAVYKSLHKLFKDGVVTKIGNKIQLNEEWIEKVAKLIKTDSPTVQLEDGEAVTYKFNGLSELDRHWKHVVKNFINNLHGPVFHSQPHEMWIHLADRFESQTEYIKSFEANKRHCFLVFGGTTAMDKEYKRAYQNEYLAVDLIDKPPYIKRNQHMTIIGDSIITTILSDSLSERIDAVYDSTNTVDPNFDKKILEAFSNPGKVMLRIEKNLLKAQKVRKQLSKNFYISQELINQYKLYN
jgi:hypothetical protein